MIKIVRELFAQSAALGFPKNFSSKSVQLARQLEPESRYLARHISTSSSLQMLSHLESRETEREISLRSQFVSNDYKLYFLNLRDSQRWSLTYLKVVWCKHLWMRQRRLSRAFSRFKGLCFGIDSVVAIGLGEVSAVPQIQWRHSDVFKRLWVVKAFNSWVDAIKLRLFA